MINKIKNLLITTFITIFVLMTVTQITFITYAQEEKAVIKKGEEFFKNKTKIRDPINLRDPFRRPIISNEDRTQIMQEGMLKDGIFTNLPSIDNVPLDDIKIVGILMGKDRRALATISKSLSINNGSESTGGGAEGGNKLSGMDGPPVIVLREGMTLGEDKAEIKAILPGGVVLVEKITNVYGQEEYLETILPIVEGKLEINKGLGSASNSPPSPSIKNKN
ncbi:MAG: hypothetical protein HQK51_18610 [Oligoflexia bacterium]|nr:hypothetical protein [Oligoflexia bacterium]